MWIGSLKIQSMITLANNSLNCYVSIPYTRFSMYFLYLIFPLLTLLFKGGNLGQARRASLQARRKNVGLNEMLNPLARIGSPRIGLPRTST